MSEGALPQQIPAAWYDAPDGSPRWRYWDGQAWTEHYAPKAAPVVPTPEPAAPVVVAPEAAASAPRPPAPVDWVSRLVWLPITIVALLLWLIPAGWAALSIFPFIFPLIPVLIGFVLMVGAFVVAAIIIRTITGWSFPYAFATAVTAPARYSHWALTRLPFSFWWGVGVLIVLLAAFTALELWLNLPATWLFFLVGIALLWISLHVDASPWHTGVDLRTRYGRTLKQEASQRATWFSGPGKFLLILAGVALLLTWFGGAFTFLVRLAAWPVTLGWGGIAVNSADPWVVLSSLLLLVAAWWPTSAAHAMIDARRSGQSDDAEAWLFLSLLHLPIGLHTPARGMPDAAHPQDEPQLQSQDEQ